MASRVKTSPGILARSPTALRPAVPPLTPLPAKRPQVSRLSSGKGVKGETGSRTRSAARRASTERVRISGPQARPLMPLERPKPLVWGAVKEAKRPAGCTPDDRGRLAPFPPGREGRGDGWRARNAPFSRSPALPAWGRCVGPARWNHWPFSRFKTDSAYDRPAGCPRKRRRRFLRAWRGEVAPTLKNAPTAFLRALVPVLWHAGPGLLLF